MLFLGYIFIVFIASCYSDAQIAYSRIVSYDPRYLLRTVPVRRSIDSEYPRIHLPISRYFPQVDTQVVPATYVAAEPIAYRLPNGEVYAVPSAWANDDDDEEAQVAENGDNDYDNYEYDNEYAPVYSRPESTYPEEVYGTEQEEAEPTEDLYKGLFANYLLRKEMTPYMDQANNVNVKRTKETLPSTDEFAIEKKSNNASDATSAPAKPTMTDKSQDRSTSLSPTSVAETLPTSTFAPKVAAPISRVHKSVDQAPNKVSIQQGRWENFDENARGQKETPYYRPFQMVDIRRQPITLLQDELSRDKNSVSNKNALPMIEKLMAAAHRSRDPLTEQLDNLKFRNM